MTWPNFDRNISGIRWNTIAGVLLLLTPPSAFGQAVTTYHNDNSRGAVNPSETILDTSNVNVNTFGKLFSRTVDGQIYAQPLYVPNLTFPGKGTHNAVFVATIRNNVYAFDADVASAPDPLWQVNLGATMPSVVCCQVVEVQPEIGILGTPVIDVSSGTLYVVAENYINSTASFKLHALDLTTGADKFPAVTIQGSVSPSSAFDAVNGVLAFNPLMHWQRPGLLLLNGKIYIAFGGHQDRTPYHGWLFSYNAATLAQTGILCFSPNGEGNGIWHGGVAPAADAAGNIYLETGNGPLTANTGGGKDYGDAVVKVSTAGGGMTITDYFSPSTQVADSNNDWDLGSSGPVLIPGTSLGLAGGKDGKMYVFSQNNLGGFNATTDQNYQEWQATYSYVAGTAAGFWGGNYIFYNNKMYGFGERDLLKAFNFDGAHFATTPSSQSTYMVPAAISNDPGMSISANGTTPGTAVLWASYSTSFNQQDGKAYPGILRAVDASDVSKELWNSDMNSARDSAGNWAKWVPPTIANGKVYLGSFDDRLNVFGILSGVQGHASGGGGSLFGTGNSSTATANLTTEGTTDWIHWGEGAPPNRKNVLTAKLSDYTLVGSGTINSYANDPRILNWTDGTPTPADSNGNGIFVGGIGNGFSFTAPADTTARKLIVHVGGFGSGGTLTAHLSDSSAPDYVDTTTALSGAYDRNYTLTYSSPSAGKTLTVTWVASSASGAGNVDLNGVALSVLNVTVTATAGTPQSAPANAVFGTALKATVKDAGSNPVSGIAVVFTAPGSGASATFSTGTTATAVTDATGVATAPTLTANSTAGGPYNVTATVPGVAGTANFALTNTPVPVHGSLGGVANNFATAADLTTEGTLDWIHWGEGAANRKNGVAAQLTDYTVVGSGTVSTYGNDARQLNWEDGTPTPTFMGNVNGVFISGLNNGFTFNAPAGTVVRKLTVHVGGFSSSGTLTAHLSDGSAPDFVDPGPVVGTAYDRNYTLFYSAGSAGQTLQVQWVMTGGSGGNVSLSAAALSSVTLNVTVSAGTPQTSAPGAAFATALQALVKDAGNSPVAGVPVIFAAPGSGASATFSAGTTAAAVTNASGIATAPTLTANATVGGPYIVTATVSGMASSANFSLTNAGTPPGSITATAGTPQGTNISTVFPTALQATVKDGSNNPLNGITVTFTAPASGAAATFSTGATATAVTNASGIATAPQLTANSTLGGPYTVTATVVGVASPANFLLTNNAGVGSGSLSVSGDSLTATANLTTEGTADWIHWGDSSLNRKAGVTAQISTYAVIGSANVSSYSNDPRGLSWTDGTPTASSTTNLSGVFVAFSGNGFSFTVPADTTNRKLTVHIGGYFSSGTLTAHLSDGSATDFTETTALVNNPYDRNYVLNYRAGGPGQTLTLKWVMASGSGNVSLSGAALTSSSPSISATAGTPQSTKVSTVFATALKVTVKDANNSPMVGTTVTFTAPGSGASATFSSGPQATALTDASGIATAPTLTANATAGGPYTVAANAAGVGTANFSLTNTPMAGAGTLSGSGDSVTTAANLTTEGSADWVHWGDASLNRKTGVTAQISTYTVVGGGGIQIYSNDARALSWTDGTPTASNPSDPNGVYVNSAGNGFSITAPADTTSRTLIVHVGGYFSSGTLTAHLSDSSAPDFTDTTAVVNNPYDRNYTLNYNAAGPGQTLSVKWVMASGSGNVSLSAAALTGSGTIGGLPTVTSITPARAPRSRPIPVVLTGTNFVAGASISTSLPTNLISIGAPTVVNANQINSTFTIAATAPIGPFTVTVTTSAGSSAPISFTIGDQDFNSDGYPDLVWENDTSGAVVVNYYGGTGGATYQSWNWLNPTGIPGWRVVAKADFNTDGVPDLVWQNDATRQVVVNYYGGTGGATYQSWNWLNSAGIPGWRVVAAADFNGDGVPDLVWENDTSGAVVVNYYGGTGGATYQSWNWLNPTGIPGWRVAAAADFNGDGVPDLVWQNDASRQVVVNYYGGTGGATYQSWNWLNSAGIPGWRVVAAADFNGDGVPDLVWQDDTSRQVVVNYYGGSGGATYQSWNWLNSAGIPGWSVIK